MFSGSALNLEEEEDDAKREMIERTAKQTGMPIEEVQLSFASRERMEKQIDEGRFIGGSEESGIVVERDGNLPAKFYQVKINDSAKGQGKAEVEKMLVDALHTAAEKSKEGREEAQRDMMKFIGEGMKKLTGKA
jgi:DNA-binding protein YbaB